MEKSPDSLPPQWSTNKNEKRGLAMLDYHKTGLHLGSDSRGGKIRVYEGEGGDGT